MYSISNYATCLKQKLNEHLVNSKTMSSLVNVMLVAVRQ